MLIKLLYIFTRMVGLGVGIGISAKTGIDFSSFDPTILVPKIPDIPTNPDIHINVPEIKYPDIHINMPEFKFPEISYPASQIQVTQGSNYGSLLLIGSIAVAALIITNKIIGVTTNIIGIVNNFTNNVTGLLTNSVNSLFQSVKSFFQWQRQENLEVALPDPDPFEGYDLNTALTGIAIGSFNLLDINKVVGVWQVLSGDGLPVGVWLIENLVQHQNENLMPYSRLYKGVKWETLKKELGEIIELTSEKETERVVEVEEIIEVQEAEVEEIIEVQEAEVEEINEVQEINPPFLRLIRQNIDDVVDFSKDLV